MTWNVRPCVRARVRKSCLIDFVLPGESPGDLGNGKAFGDDNNIAGRAPQRDQEGDLAGRHGGRQLVMARLHLPGDMVEPGGQHKAGRRMHQAAPGEQSANRAGIGPGRDCHQDTAGGPVGAGGGEHAGDLRGDDKKRGQQQEHKDGQRGVTPGAGRRRVFRLRHRR